MDRRLIKVSTVEDNEFMREGWEEIINSQDDFLLIGSYESCEDAFADDEFKFTNIALMDIELPGMNGIEGVKYIRENYPDMIVVMATVFDDNEHVFEAIRNGAIGYMLKKTNPETFSNAIRTAMDGGSPMTPEIARKVIQFMQPQKSDDPEVQLTEREQEILKELATGKSYKDIGDSIFLSEDGVRYHIRNIYQKLHVNSRSQAVAKGMKQKLI
ncbi:response regulator [Rhodohalobacter mucosus]|uniref:DNA-binding response regulator n=1 Tax=Rhodohalobacter mucosus TaxID=2079485 RepID=A0A316TR24_9BACT|nr:response regulator transcription factor [Rhodohalobacter mucosus]PWN07063.1 DNA-binding response regulator [Rhodohalobacter mucosus]